MLFFSSTSVFAEGISCIVLKFTDDTRFTKIGTADMLNEVFLEKLFDSGKFSLKETRALDAEAERKIFDGESVVAKNMRQAASTGKYDAIFEGEGFNENKALDISHAKRGQIVAPELMASIGKKHDAKYIIQGTVVKIGKGLKFDRSIGDNAFLIGGLANIAGYGGAGRAIHDTMGDVERQDKTLGVVIVLKMIEAETGKVIWDTAVLGKSTISEHSSRKNNVAIGSSNVSGDTLFKAVNDAAEQGLQALLQDEEMKYLFR